MNSSEKPTVAFVLSLIGGIIVLLVGLLISARGAVLGRAGTYSGLLGATWGVLIIVGAVMLSTNPKSHTTWGALIIVFSALSWIGAVGGLFVGFILGLVGGILALTWHPNAPQAVQLPPAGSSVAPGSPSSQPPAQDIMYCAICGTEMAKSATFCPRCGAKQPS